MTNTSVIRNIEDYFCSSAGGITGVIIKQFLRLYQRLSDHVWCSVHCSHSFPALVGASESRGPRREHLKRPSSWSGCSEGLSLSHIWEATRGSSDAGLVQRRWTLWRRSPFGPRWVPWRRKCSSCRLQTWPYQTASRHCGTLRSHIQVNLHALFCDQFISHVSLCNCDAAVSFNYVQMHFFLHV